MLYSLQSAFGKATFNASRRIVLTATSRFKTVYFKPFAIATLVTVLMSVAFCFVFITLSKSLFANSQMPALLPTGLQNETITPGQENVARQRDFTTVRLDDHTVYRLQAQSTYQEIATTDAGTEQQIKAQLDAHGIEYDVFENNSTPVLIHKGERIISWGGILYLPEVNALVLQH